LFFIIRRGLEVWAVGGVPGVDLGGEGENEQATRECEKDKFAKIHSSSIYPKHGTHQIIYPWTGRNRTFSFASLCWLDDWAPRKGVSRLVLAGAAWVAATVSNVSTGIFGNGLGVVSDGGGDS
jgi:hypothetical protein